MKKFHKPKNGFYLLLGKKSKETNKELFIRGKNENIRSVTFSLISIYISKQIDIRQPHFNKLSVCLPFCFYFFLFTRLEVIKIENSTYFFFISL